MQRHDPNHVEVTKQEIFLKLKSFSTFTNKYLIQVQPNYIF